MFGGVKKKKLTGHKTSWFRCQEPLGTKVEDKSRLWVLQRLCCGEREKVSFYFASSTELPRAFQMPSWNHIIPVCLWKAPIWKFLPLLHSSFLLAFVCACLACLHACVCCGRWISALEDGKYSNLNGSKLAVSRTIGTLGKMQYGAPCFLKLFWHSSQEVSVSVHYHPQKIIFLLCLSLVLVIFVSII